ALLADEDQINRRLQIIVDATTRHPAPEAKRTPMRVEHHLLCFAQVGYCQEHPTMGESQVRHLDLLHLPAQFDRLVAPIELIRFARRNQQWNEYPATAPPPFFLPAADRALQRRIRPAETFLDQRVIEPLTIAPLAQRLAGVFTQQFQ